MGELGRNKVPPNPPPGFPTRVTLTLGICTYVLARWIRFWIQKASKNWSQVEFE